MSLDAQVVSGGDVSSPAPPTTPAARFPKRFLTWAATKTAIQVTVSFFSIAFIAQSNLFVPFAYDPTVWSRESIRILYLPQGLFEVGDLAVELWMLRRQKSKGHLPWDSIAHHLVSALYAFYIYTNVEHLDRGFLGLAASALACQVIGPLYTLHRLRVRWRFLPLAILTVQIIWRCPLAIVSLFRAAQYYHEAPWAHFMICTVLAYLDYRWTVWAYKLHIRTQDKYRMAKAELTKQRRMSGDFNTPAPVAKGALAGSQHLKAL
mmetsp:Transcript_22370/g.63626  ORF Transcript_22370/g.63626 Transcript_22370/m.63626 type:complete len:263 (+) Transcript_22370:176-964(+)